MQAAIVVTWSRIIPGREMKAMQYGMEIDEFYGTLAAEGKCTPPESFFSASGHNLWMVKGDLEVLRQISDLEDAMVLREKGYWLLEGFMWEYYLTGDAAEADMARFVQAGQELELI